MFNPKQLKMFTSAILIGTLVSCGGKKKSGENPAKSPVKVEKVSMLRKFAGAFKRDVGVSQGQINAMVKEQGELIKDLQKGQGVNDLKINQSLYRALLGAHYRLANGLSKSSEVDFKRANDELSKTLNFTSRNGHNPLTFKRDYEAVIENTLAPRGQELQYKSSQTNAVKIIDTKLMQCFSGTYLYDLLTRHAFLNQSKKIKKLDELNLVKIYRQGHVLPGVMKKIGSVFHLIGIETTAGGRAIIYYGDPAKVKGKIRIVESSLDGVIDVFKFALPARDINTLVNSALKMTAEKYGYHLDRENYVANGVKSTEFNQHFANQTGLTTSPNASRENKELNSTPFAFGSTSISDRIMKRKKIDIISANTNSTSDIPSAVQNAANFSIALASEPVKEDRAAIELRNKYVKAIKDFVAKSEYVSSDDHPICKTAKAIAADLQSGRIVSNGELVDGLRTLKKGMSSYCSSDAGNALYLSVLKMPNLTAYIEKNLVKGFSWDLGSLIVSLSSRGKLTALNTQKKVFAFFNSAGSFSSVGENLTSYALELATRNHKLYQPILAKLIEKVNTNDVSKIKIVYLISVLNKKKMLSSSDYRLITKSKDKDLNSIIENDAKVGLQRVNSLTSVNISSLCPKKGLIAGTHDGVVTVNQMKNGKLVFSQKLSSSINEVIFSFDCKKVIVVQYHWGRENYSVVSINIKSKKIEVLGKSDSRIKDIESGPGVILVNKKIGAILMKNISGGKRAIGLGSSRFLAAKFSPNGRFLVGIQGNTLRVIEVSSAKNIYQRELDLEEGFKANIVMNKKGTSAVIVSSTGKKTKLAILDLSDLSSISYEKAGSYLHTSKMSYLTANGERLFIIGEDKVMRLYFIQGTRVRKSMTIPQLNFVNTYNLRGVQFDSQTESFYYETEGRVDVLRANLP